MNKVSSDELQEYRLGYLEARAKHLPVDVAIRRGKIKMYRYKQDERVRLKGLVPLSTIKGKADEEFENRVLTEIIREGSI